VEKNSRPWFCRREGKTAVCSWGENNEDKNGTKTGGTRKRTGKFLKKQDVPTWVRAACKKKEGEVDAGGEGLKQHAGVRIE